MQTNLVLANARIAMPATGLIGSGSKPILGRRTTAEANDFTWIA